MVKTEINLYSSVAAIILLLSFTFILLVLINKMSIRLMLSYG